MTHGRKQGNGGTQEAGAIYSFETFREPPECKLRGSFSVSSQALEAISSSGVVVKASVTPANAIALQSKVKEEQAEHGELLQHARADR